MVLATRRYARCTSSGLSKLAEALTFPLLKKQLQGWAPFDGPEDHIEFVESLREILDDRNPANGGGTLTSASRWPTIAHKFLWPLPPHTRRMLCSTNCPC